MKNQKQNNKNKHQPVLLKEVLDYLKPQDGDCYLDVTAGYGGHAKAILERTHKPQRAVLIDRDQMAVSHLQQLFSPDISIVHGNFLEQSLQLQRLGKKFDIILADLGVSSPHLDIASRGFSIRDNGPLDMRMDENQKLTAGDIVNTYTQKDLAELLKEYGEEPKAHAIARLIVLERPMQTTHQLAKIVTKVWPGHSRVHPATRTFQALRIAVNNELALLKQALPVWTDMLNKNGRLAVISFHSLEDRVVKRYFAEQSKNRYEAVLKLSTNRPVTASHDELVLNPRARSAKLRVAVKI